MAEAWGPLRSGALEIVHEIGFGAGIAEHRLGFEMD